MAEERGSFERLILRELDAQTAGLQRVEDKVEALLVDVAMLKVKAGVWGATAGMIPGAVAIVVAVVVGS